MSITSYCTNTVFTLQLFIKILTIMAGRCSRTCEGKGSSNVWSDALLCSFKQVRSTIREVIFKTIALHNDAHNYYDLGLLFLTFQQSIIR